MSAQPQRTLVDRWYFGVLPQVWERAVDALQDRLRNLERILSVLHRAVEHPAPTVETATVPVTGNTAITSTTPAALTGASLTYTPDVDMTVVVSASYDAECTLFGAITHAFLGSLFLTTGGGAATALTGVALCTPAALNHRQMPSQTWHVALQAGTTYVFALYGSTTNAGTTFLVRGTHTRFSVARFPNLFRA